MPLWCSDLANIGEIEKTTFGKNLRSRAFLEVDLEHIYNCNRVILWGMNSVIGQMVLLPLLLIVMIRFLIILLTWVRIVMSLVSCLLPDWLLIFWDFLGFFCCYFIWIIIFWFFLFQSRVFFYCFFFFFFWRCPLLPFSGWLRRCLPARSPSRWEGEFASVTGNANRNATCNILPSYACTTLHYMKAHNSAPEYIIVQNSPGYCLIMAWIVHLIVFSSFCLVLSCAPLNRFTLSSHIIIQSKQA